MRCFSAVPHLRISNILFCVVIVALFLLRSWIWDADLKHLHFSLGAFSINQVLTFFSLEMLSNQSRTSQLPVSGELGFNS